MEVNYTLSRVDSAIYSFEYPLEFIKYYTLPPERSWIGNRDLFEDYHKLIHWTMGKVGRPFSIVRQSGAADRFSYPCELEPNCPGGVHIVYTKISTDHVGRSITSGIVERSMYCSCLRNCCPLNDNSWIDLISVKYENDHHALSAVTWFFAIKCIAPPIFRFVCNLSARNYNTIRFPLSAQDPPTMQFQMFRGTDGGFHISDTITYESRPQKKFCTECGLYNGDVSSGHMMFQLNCSRNHTICDGCIGRFILKRCGGRFIDSGNIDSAIEFVRDHHLECSRCKVRVSSEFGVALEGCTNVHAILPKMFIGEKAIMSIEFFNSFAHLYNGEIDWFARAVVKFREEKRLWKEHVKRLKERYNGAKMDSSTDSADLEYDRMKLKHNLRYYRKIGKVVRYLGKRMCYVSFLFDGNADLPMELLQDDDVYFQRVLDYNSYRGMLDNLDLSNLA